MAEAHHLVSFSLPREVIWAFCMTPSNWAELIPGYTSHRAIDDRRSVWEVHVDLGPFTRLVEAEVTVTEVVEMESVRFAIEGSDATPFSGEGAVRAAGPAGTSSVEIDITMTPRGPLGPVVNAVAAPVLPRMTEEFADALVRKIEGVVATGNRDEHA